MLPDKSIHYFCMLFNYFAVTKNVFFYANVFKIILIAYWKLLMS